MAMASARGIPVHTTHCGDTWKHVGGGGGRVGYGWAGVVWGRGGGGGGKGEGKGEGGGCGWRDGRCLLNEGAAMIGSNT